MRSPVRASRENLEVLRTTLSSSGVAMSRRLRDLLIFLLLAIAAGKLQRALSEKELIREEVRQMVETSKSEDPYWVMRPRQVWDERATRDPFLEKMLFHHFIPNNKFH